MVQPVHGQAGRGERPTGAAMNAERYQSFLKQLDDEELLQAWDLIEAEMDRRELLDDAIETIEAPRRLRLG